MRTFAPIEEVEIPVHRLDVGQVTPRQPERELSLHPVEEQREEDRYEKSYGMNRFARFVSALAFEVDASFDDAEINLRQLRDELPDNESIRYSLERALRLQGPDAESE